MAQLKHGRCGRLRAHSRIVIRDVTISQLGSSSKVLGVTRAAGALLGRWLYLKLRDAGRCLAHELTLRLGAKRRTFASPGAVCIFAHRVADRVRNLALSVTVERGTDRVAFWAVTGLTFFHRAADRALLLSAVHGARGFLRLVTLNGAVRTITDGVTHSRATRIITVPTALRVAFGSLSDCHKGQESEPSRPARHHVFGH